MAAVYVLDFFELTDAGSDDEDGEDKAERK
jgi:hypothetical protein